MYGAMTAEKCVAAFKNDVLPAIFEARFCSIHCDGPSIYIYPDKGRDGYVWLLMEGDIINDPLADVIRSGGREETYRDAVGVAIEALMARTDR